MQQKIVGGIAMENNLYTFLCIVIKGPRDRQQIRRIAKVNAQGISPFFEGEFDDSIRESTFYDRGNFKEGEIGVWKWVLEENFRKQNEVWYSTERLERYRPIRVCTLNTVNNDEELIQCLQEGIDESKYDCDTIFVYKKNANEYRGVFCRQEDLEEASGRMFISSDIYSLPLYEVQCSDVLRIIFDYQTLHFYEKLSLGKPIEYISLCAPRDCVKKMFLDRLSWNTFKETMGGTKKEWSKCKSLIERLADENLSEVISNKLHCTLEEADSYVEEFKDHIAYEIARGDIEEELVLRVAKENDDYRSMCEKNISDQWKKEHKKDIDDANEDLKKLRDEVVIAQGKLEQVERNLKESRAEVERNGKLNDKLIQDIQNKLANAQEDLSGFFAEVSLYTPLLQTQQISSVANAWSYTSRPIEVRDFELNASWQDEYRTIGDNLHRADDDLPFIKETLCNELAAFLYAAHLQRVPLFLLGPCGEEIATSLSLALYGESVGCLALGEGNRSELYNYIEQQQEQVIIIKNMFSQGWTDELLPLMYKSNKYIFWSHPYVEDMMIEPRGIYNYGLPLLTELFLENVPSDDWFHGKRANDFNELQTEKELKKLSLRTIKDLKLSPFIYNRLERVISDAKIISKYAENIPQNKKVNETDMEILFGVLPFAILFGKNELLTELLDSNGAAMSPEVKHIINRYVEE